jgi:hypothetical protein
MDALKTNNCDCPLAGDGGVVCGWLNLSSVRGLVIHHLSSAAAWPWPWPWWGGAAVEPGTHG